jgi:hypothetical protein
MILLSAYAPASWYERLLAFLLREPIRFGLERRPFFIQLNRTHLMPGHRIRPEGRSDHNLDLIIYDFGVDTLEGKRYKVQPMWQSLNAYYPSEFLTPGTKFTLINTLNTGI